MRVNTSIDAKLCINVANAYLDTAIYCDKTDRKTSHQTLQFSCNAFFSVPEATNLAFACELYLKAISVYCSSGGVSRSHNLFCLFKELPLQQQTELEELFLKYNSYPSVTLGSTLEKHAKVFEEWRYIYEYPNRKATHTYEVYIDNLLAAAKTLQAYISKRNTLVKTQEGAV